MQHRSRLTFIVPEPGKVGRGLKQLRFPLPRKRLLCIAAKAEAQRERRPFGSGVLIGQPTTAFVSKKMCAGKLGAINAVWDEVERKL